MGQCRRRREVVALIGLCAAASCGGGSGETVKLDDAAACQSAWQPLTAPVPYDVTSGLVYQAGTLYYSSFNAQAIVAVATDGAASTVLASGYASELWLEDDHLLFPSGELANQIFSLPLAGGTPELVLDGGAGRTSPGVAMAHTFDATDFYWTEQPRGSIGSSSVWRQARAGAAPAQIGALPFTDPSGAASAATAIALAGDTVVVGSAFGQAGTVPAGGGDVTPLATPTASAPRNVESDLAGLDALGAYWAVPPTDDQPASLVLSPIDGGPAASFWPTLPASAEPVRIWPNPEGGWIVASFQIFADGIDHMTIWSIDPQGKRTRLACSPGKGLDSAINHGVAVAPDAIYVPAENLSADTWEIDRIAR